MMTERQVEQLKSDIARAERNARWDRSYAPIARDLRRILDAHTAQQKEN